MRVRIAYMETMTGERYLIETEIADLTVSSIADAIWRGELPIWKNDIDVPLTGGHLDWRPTVSHRVVTDNVGGVVGFAFTAECDDYMSNPSGDMFSGVVHTQFSEGYKPKELVLVD